ncbi:MAG: Crp/Fnr family transcriptional regulator [Proteobacteria bacterium]|nr:Crp/Fnr family transcriptional regulator [Pseudomonadota bacterium]
MTTPKRAAATNRLLAGLPDPDRRRLLSRSSSIELATAEVLYEPGKRIHDVYFPIGGSVSLITTLRGHDRLEVGLVGDEGMLGTSLVLGVTIAPSLALVQDSGTAWRIDAASFREELERSVALRVRLQRYVHVVMCQSAQTVACTRFHVVEARLARWLLMTLDRAHSDHFHSTHELLASILGVRRAGVTHAAGSLQQQKLIRYSRGEITILDRRGLEKSACACYVANQDTYARVMN